MDTRTAMPPTDYKKILVAFDGSSGSRSALRRALRIAQDQAIQLVVFSVDEHVPRYVPAVGKVEEESEIRDEHFAELKAKALEEVGTSRRVEFVTEVGHAAQAIVERAAAGGFDLVVIGHTGHSGVWGSLLGSTSARVVEQAQCDVLVVR